MHQPFKQIKSDDVKCYGNGCKAKIKLFFSLFGSLTSKNNFINPTGPEPGTVQSDLVSDSELLYIIIISVLSYLQG